MKIKRRDLEEIRRRYDLRYKEGGGGAGEGAEDKSSYYRSLLILVSGIIITTYRYSSHMSRQLQTSSPPAGDQRDTYGRVKQQPSSSSRKPSRRRKEEWKYSQHGDTPDPSSGGQAKLTPHQRYARRKSYDYQSRSSSPMPNYNHVRSVTENWKT